MNLSGKPRTIVMGIPGRASSAALFLVQQARSIPQAKPRVRSYWWVATAVFLVALVTHFLCGSSHESATPALSAAGVLAATDGNEMAGKTAPDVAGESTTENGLTNEAPPETNSPVVDEPPEDEPDNHEPEDNELQDAEPAEKSFQERLALQERGIDQEYTEEELWRIYAVASGEEPTDGILGYLKRTTALRVVSGFVAKLSKDEYQKVAALLRNCENADKFENYETCKGEYDSRFQKTLELDQYMERVDDPFTKALWRDILRFREPFAISTLDFRPILDFEDVAEKIRFEQRLNMADVARIQWLARLYHKYFAIVEREHIKMSLLELKLAHLIPRDWGKYGDYGSESPRRISIYSGDYSVEDFNDKHLLEQYNRHGKQSAAAKAVKERINALVSEQPVKEFHPQIKFSSFVLEMLYLRRESSQLCSYDDFEPRVRPTTLAIAGSAPKPAFGYVDPYPMRIASGVPTEELENSPQSVGNVILTKGMYVLAQGRRDNLWRVAEVAKDSRSGDVEVEYIMIGMPDDGPLPRSRILMEKECVDELPPESFLFDEDVAAAEEKGDQPDFLDILPPKILKALGE